MSGFWAGAVPPWAYAVGACLFILAVLLGMWAGYERGFKHAAEEQRWAREQAKARRVHAVYRQPSKPDDWPVDPVWSEHAGRWLCGYGCDALKGTNPECPMHNDLGWLIHEDQALTIANGQPVDTGEIQAIIDRADIMVARWKADNDIWMAEHGLSDG